MPSPQYSTVLHKRNATPGAIPTLSSLSAGELAMNENDGKIFIRTINDTIETFPNENQIPYKLNTSLSAVVPQYGNNVVSQVLSNILGGYSNQIVGAASTITNGELNSLSGDFGFIGSGALNVITPAGDFSAILGGHHNLISHANSFALGSNLSSHAENFTYVNNISGTYYGDGSKLTGIVSPVGIYVPLSGGQVTGDLTVTGSFSTVNTANWQSAYTTVESASASWQQAYTNLTSNSAAYLSGYENAGGDLAGTYPNPTVAKIQGYTISTQTPSVGQMLQWSGAAWVPGSIPQGGSGGGGISYFLNYGTASDSHPGLSDPVSELGRFTYTTLTSTTLTNVAQDVYTPIAGFITDFLDPVVSTIPAGLWDIAIWLSSTATNTTQMILKAELYTYNTALSTTTLIATSDDLDIYDPTVIAQYTPSIVVPQTTISSNDRIYLKLLARATSNNKDITVYFGGNRPSHIHTTIPSVGGSGLVKVLNGVYQSPASLLVDVDVAENAQINQTKVAGLTAALASKLPLAGGTLTGGLTGTTANFTEAVYSSTAVAGTSSTQLATTAFVQDSVSIGLASGSAIASTVVALVTNADSVTLTRGTVVYSYGSQGDRVSVRMASASAESTSSKTFGFVNETIAVGQTGYVTLYGTMDKLDLGSPFVAGDALWLGTIPGTYTRVKPQAPTHLVYLGVVQRANAGNGTAYIKVQNGYELNEIHDVLITTPLSAQILQRNDDNTLWINKTPLFNDTQIVNSGKWNNTNTTVTSNSAKWESVYSTVNSISGAQYLHLSGGTLTGGLTGTTATFNSISAASVAGNGSLLTGLTLGQFGTVSAGSALNQFVGDGSTETYPIAGFNGLDKGGYIVSVGGIDQPGSFWEVSAANGGQIIFDEAPKNGEVVSIRVLTGVVVGATGIPAVFSSLSAGVFVGNGSGLTNVTVIDWMALVRGYNATPTLLATLPTGDVYSYVYNSSPSNKTYYRYIATDGSEDAFYSSFSSNTLTGLVASKSITI